MKRGDNQSDFKVLVGPKLSPERMKVGPQRQTWAYSAARDKAGRVILKPRSSESDASEPNLERKLQQRMLRHRE